MFLFEDRLRDLQCPLCDLSRQWLTFLERLTQKYFRCLGLRGLTLTSHTCCFPWTSPLMYLNKWCGCVPIKLDLWTLKFEHHMIVMCHGISFFVLSSTVQRCKKYLTSCRHTGGGQTWPMGGAVLGCGGMFQKVAGHGSG